MPPKRAASTKDPRPDARKKFRSSNSSIGTDSSASDAVPRSKRWSKGISGSANLDADYKEATSDPLKAYQFITLCRVPFSGDESDEDGGSDEDAMNDGVNEREKQPPCDGGKKCLCGKPAAENPTHPWKLSVAARRKWFNQHTMCDLRDPATFDMHTYTDHAAYGTLEGVQNLILDFAEADVWREKWAVTEALGFFLNTDQGQMISQIDDGETADATYLLLGRLFLSMLARLEREDQLNPSASSIPNLALVMGLFIQLASAARSYGCLEFIEHDESLGPKKDKKTWKPTAYDDHVLAYANKYSLVEQIAECGLLNIGTTLAQCNSDADLPLASANIGMKADPWGFAKALKEYKREHGAGFVGGDRLDITTWSSGERKAHTFDESGKDPLRKDALEALRKGLPNHEWQAPGMPIRR